MKWVFLIAQDATLGSGPAFYDFVPYRFGPYSFTLQHELGNLVRDGLIHDVNGLAWKLTEDGEQAARCSSGLWAEGVNGTLRRHAHATNANKLIRYVYAKYPWFTINAQDLTKRRGAAPTAELAVYTMGYEKQSVDSVLNTALRHGVRRIIDVRANPISRRYGFHKSTLSRLAEFVGLSYEHVPTLGIDPGRRANPRYRVGATDLFDWYEEHTLAEQTADVHSVAEMMLGSPSTLLCMEADPRHCHRSRLADSVAALANLSVIHLASR